MCCLNITIIFCIKLAAHLAVERGHIKEVLSQKEPDAKSVFILSDGNITSNRTCEDMGNMSVQHKIPGN